MLPKLEDNPIDKEKILKEIEVKKEATFEESV